MRKSLFMILSSIILIVGGQAAFSGGHSVTLDDVKARGNLLCGVSTGAPGFATVDDSGKDVGFDVDYCRALAAAIFGVFATGADVFFDYELPEALQPLFILIFLGFTIGVGYGNYDAWKNYGGNS